VSKVSIFDVKQSGCEACEAIESEQHGPQKVLVAFGSLRNATAIVLEATPGVRNDFEEAGIDAGDVWDCSRLNIGEGSIMVWEGRIVYTTTPSSPNGPSEFDVDYVGDFRNLTDAEWDALKSGRDLWPIEEHGISHSCNRKALCSYCGYQWNSIERSSE